VSIKFKCASTVPLLPQNQNPLFLSDSQHCSNDDRDGRRKRRADLDAQPLQPRGDYKRGELQHPRQHLQTIRRHFPNPHHPHPRHLPSLPYRHVALQKHRPSPGPHGGPGH